MHRLAYPWTNFVKNNRITPPRLDNDGIIDLTNLSEGGILTDGYYEDVNHIRYPINGKVYDVFGLTRIELLRNDGFMRWEGVLVFDDSGQLTIAGRRFVPQFVADQPRTFDQVQDPWIITKP